MSERDDAIGEVIADIVRICDRLDDLALEVLYEATRSEEAKRPDLDRRLVRARRALERAQAALRIGSVDPDEP